MFVKLRTARYLKARADASGVTVGYSGVAARIARVHQFGERDQVARAFSPITRYVSCWVSARQMSA